MSKTKIYLVVQDNCPSCLRVKTNLQRVDNWKEVITVINMFKKDGTLNDITKKHDINESPSLFAIEDDKVVAIVRGSNVLTRSFLDATVKKYMVDPEPSVS